MSLEYIDIGNPGAPNNDPATNAPYNPLHLLVPAHVNAPGGTLVIFNNSTNDLFFTFTYNRYRIKVPATQRREVGLHTSEPHGFSYVVGTTTAVLVGQPDVYIECYEPGECVPPFSNGANGGAAVASAGIPVTIAAIKGQVYSGSGLNPFGPITALDIFAPAAGLYVFFLSVQKLDANVTPGDYISIIGGNNSQASLSAGSNAILYHPRYQAQNTPPVYYYCDGFTPFLGINFYAGLPMPIWAAEGDELFLNVGVSNSSGQAFVYTPSIRVDAALALYQPY